MMDSDLTIAQVASVIGCTKGTVRFHLSKLKDEMLYKDNRGIYHITESGIQHLKTLINPSPVESATKAESPTSPIWETIEILKEELIRKDEQLTQQLAKKDEQLARKDEQLVRKDEQLVRKDEQITNLTKLIDQQQHLQIATQPKIPNVLNDSGHPKNKRKWWKCFWRGR
ncbi:hypothetical protein FACS189481_4100 [Clostridia bacterium]|nr:hypothetical protein FACS189481_4100 [Clostridia bacterium]